MTYVVKITTKGRITIPKAVREKLDLEPGDRFRFGTDGGWITISKIGETVRSPSAPAGAAGDVRDSTVC